MCRVPCVTSRPMHAPAPDASGQVRSSIGRTAQPSRPHRNESTRPVGPPGDGFAVVLFVDRLEPTIHTPHTESILPTFLTCSDLPDPPDRYTRHNPYPTRGISTRRRPAMRVMIIGASTNPDKFGHKAVRAYRAQGHDVLPINPNADLVAGIPAFADVADPPGPIDRATIYLPPEKGLAVIDALAARGDVRQLWLNPGAESEQLLDHARRLGFQPVVVCSITAIGQRPELL
jgi:hypothetical protein